MDRRSFLSRAALGTAPLFLTGRPAAADDGPARARGGPPPAFTFLSKSKAEHRAGTFVCAACYLPLFASATKFESGTGWPSFTAPIAGRVATKRDFALVLPRTEYHCARCGGHQGHLFDDGPPPTGARYCNNGLALRFAPAGAPLPALRT